MKIKLLILLCALLASGQSFAGKDGWLKAALKKDNPNQLAYYVGVGKIYTRRLKKSHKGFGDTFFLYEVFVKINGKQHYLC